MTAGTSRWAEVCRPTVCANLADGGGVAGVDRGEGGTAEGGMAEGAADANGGVVACSGPTSILPNSEGGGATNMLPTPACARTCAAACAVGRVILPRPDPGGTIADTFARLGSDPCDISRRTGLNDLVVRCWTFSALGGRLSGELP